MAILVHTEPIPPAPYAAALRAAEPGCPVWTLADEPPGDAVEAILAWRLKPGVLSRYPKLRVLCSIGAGVEKLLALPDLPAHVPVTRVVDPQQCETISRYVLASALQHLCDLPEYRAQQPYAEWRRHPNRPLERSRIGILGLGEVGQAIARAFVAVGLPVAGWSRRPREVAGVDNLAGDDALPALLARSDVLVCALPLTDATRRLLGSRVFAQLPAGAYVINVGRGGHLVEDDLRAALDSGHLAGAALDVFSREPLPPDHWIWRHPRITATPHVAGAPRASVVAQACIAALRAVREGRTPPLAVDRGAGY